MVLLENATYVLTGGKDYNLILKINYRTFLVENLEIQNGLVNGSSEILKRILFDESNQAEVLIIRFESYCGPSFFEDKKFFPLKRS